MGFVGIIPARYASSRFPGKPLADIGGKPMIEWVYERASKALATVYVATDDERIAAVVRSFGGRVAMTSPDHQSGTDRLAEAVDFIQAETGQTFDGVVNIQGDEPFIDPQQITDLVECFADPLTDIATLIKPIADNETVFNPNSPKVVVALSGEARYFSRSPIPFLRGVPQNEWHMRHTYYKHIGIYAYRLGVLKQITKLPQSPLELAESLEQLRWLDNGFVIKTRITHFEGLAVDTPEDLERVRATL